MTREAHGYFTEDNTFYERKEEADLHEAKALIYAHLVGMEIRPEPIIELLDEMRKEIEDYYAKTSAEVETRAPSDDNGSGEDDHSEPEPGGPEVDQANNGGGEDGAKSVQQQPRTRHKPVSNVGRRKRAKAVQDKRKEHGT